MITQLKSNNYCSSKGVFFTNTPEKKVCHDNNLHSANIITLKTFESYAPIPFTSKQKNSNAVAKTTIEPIGIRLLSTKDKLIGKTSVFNAQNKKVDVSVYRCFDKRYADIELYKFVEGKDRVIAYSMLQFDKAHNALV